MADRLLSGREVCERLGVTGHTLRSWRAAGRLKGRPAADGSPGCFYLVRDVQALEGLPDYAPFRDSVGLWLPMPDVRRKYPRIAPQLERWGRQGCPYLPGKRRLTPHAVLCRAPGTLGVSERYFWLDGDLAEIHRQMKRAESPQDGITLREAARESGLSAWRLRELVKAGRLSLWHERRPVERARFGRLQRYTAEKALVSRRELRKELRATAPPDSGSLTGLVTARQAVKLTKGDFSLANLAFWEARPCEWTGKTLAVVRRDVVQRLVVPFHGRPKKVRRVRRGQKHYRRAEIQEAWKAFRKRGRHGVWIDEKGEHGRPGERWLNQAAAWSLHGAYQQSLEAWRGRGLVRSFRRTRAGYGRHDGTTYYRERDIVRLKGRQRPGDGHLPEAEAAVAPSAAMAGGPADRQGRERLESRSAAAYPVGIEYVSTEVARLLRGGPEKRDRQGGAHAGKKGPADKPRWDTDRRELWCGPKLCKRYRRPARRQDRILATFEELGWPARVDDPLDRGLLRKTLDNLNSGLPPDCPIRFAGDGTGEGILWSAREPTPRVGAG
jgi:hypothetical protein